MNIRSPKSPNTTWVAVFKNDFTSKTFKDYVYSDDVLFWIKRTNNLLVHTANSTGNTYFMRNFLFFNQKLEETYIYYSLNSWKCNDLEETGRDYFGSYCKVSIEDPKGISRTFYLNGDRPSQLSLPENLYFTYILFFLKSLDQYKDWNDISIKCKDIYEDYFQKQQIPVNIIETVYLNFQERKANNDNV
ncbi:hypothetical protein [Pedobacter borealis]|uniref:hypothetical protein n=1 Tax=Pedobacter borealis TaxID=475254 RepID=UPI0004939095|nr:hypothetical protein [Pedobacter borealis]